VDLAEWSELFVATAGAAAALAGLIIVAMSVNIETIVAERSLPSRAGATIASLVLVVVVAIAGLIPGIGSTGMGWATLAFSLVALGFAIDSAVRLARLPGQPEVVQLAKGSVLIIPLLGFVIGAVLLIAGIDAGMYFVAAGILLVFVSSVLGAWVLLVEVRR
jgi:modulator of FtsH protease